MMARPFPQPIEADFEHRACVLCGARTDDDAATLCKQSSDQTGEYHCLGGAEEESYPDGRLRFFSEAGGKRLDAAIQEWVDAEEPRP